MSNLGFENYLNNKLGVRLIRTDVGDINVIDEMIKKSYSLGGEQSGHIILSEYSNTGDGILVALKILEVLSNYGKKSSNLFDIYKSYYQEQTNIFLKNKLSNKKSKFLKEITINLNKKQNNMRFLVRESGTEPLVRLLVEGKNKEEVKKEIIILKNKIEKTINA